MRPDEFYAILTNSQRPLVLVMHDNADADALGACVALSELVEGATIARPESFDRAASALFDRLKLGLAVPPLPDNVSIVAVDSSTPAHMSPRVDARVFAVIDHHFDSKAWDVPCKFIDESYFSTCEMVVDLFKNADKKPTKTGALALLTGIIADTASFRFSDERTLERAIWLMKETGVKIAEAKDILEERTRDDMSKRISRLKAAQRLKYISEGDVIVAVSEVSAFEALAAKSLIDLGADISFVASQRKDDYRISARARRDIVSEGFHAGKLLIEVGAEVGGEGGGHDGAGGLEGRGDAEHVLNVCSEHAHRKVVQMRKSRNPSQ